MSLRMCYKKRMNLYYVADRISPKLYSEFGYIKDIVNEFTSRNQDSKDFDLMVFSPNVSSKKLQKEFEIDENKVAKGRTPKIISSMIYRHLKKPLRVFNAGSIVHCFVDPSIKTSKVVKRIFEPVSAKRYIAPHLFNENIKLFTSIKNVSMCDVVIAHSNYIAEELSSKLFIDSDKIKVIPRAIEPKIDKNYKNTLKWPDKYFLFAGRIEKYKNLERFINAFSSWAPEDVNIVFAGDSVDKSYFAKIKKFTNQILGEKAIFTDYVCKQELWSAMQNAIAVFDPSYINDFPDTIIESQALGTPVIASNIVTHKEICKDTVLYFDPLCENSIKQVLDAITDKKLYDNLVKKGKANASLFTWDEIAPLYIDLYTNLHSSA